MSYSEQTLTMTVINSQRARLKLFIMNSPVLLGDLMMYKLFEADSRSLDELGFHVLKVLKHLDPLDREFSKFLALLCEIYKRAPIEEDLDVLINQTIGFFIRVKDNFIEFELYRENVLPFNTLWLERPDTLTLFRMEQKDV